MDSLNYFAAGRPRLFFKLHIIHDSLSNAVNGIFRPFHEPIDCCAAAYARIHAHPCSQGPTNRAQAEDDIQISTAPLFEQGKKLESTAVPVLTIVSSQFAHFLFNLAFLFLRKNVCRLTIVQDHVDVFKEVFRQNTLLSEHKGCGLSLAANLLDDLIEFLSEVLNRRDSLLVDLDVVVVCQLACKFGQ